MKIFYIGRFDKIYDEEQIAQALERQGVEVFRCEEDTPSKEMISKLEQFQPDRILFAKLRVYDHPRPLFTYAQKNQIPTASWTFDLYWGYSSREELAPKEYFFKADKVFSTDGGNQHRFEQAGIDHTLLRQGINKDFIYKGEKKDFDCDIAFVGCVNPQYPYRQKVLGFLEDTYGDRFKWFGKVDTNEIREGDLNDLYESVPIIFGDSVYSPHYWSNRIYETIGRGGFFIHPKVEGLDEEFTPYEDFIPYNKGNMNQLKTIIDYYLEHPEERDVIRKQGMKKVAENYTYDHRCQTLIQKLK